MSETTQYTAAELEPKVKPCRLVERVGSYSVLLRTAFDQVCNPTDWKAEVNCMVPWAAASAYTEAIEFMTGIKPTVTYETTDGQSFARLQCVGYRAGPAGP